jgi:hypothetical protein
MQRKDKIETKMVKTLHGHERAMAVARKAWDEAFELRFELGKSQQAIEAADEAMCRAYHMAVAGVQQSGQQQENEE